MNNKDEVISILGVDYGDSRVGLAFGRDGVVTPIRVVSGKDPHTAVSRIARVVKEYNIDEIVVGLPLTAEGKETPKSQEVRRFANLLKSKIKKPVHFENEHSTTKGATKLMLNMGVSQKRRRTKDHYSAAIILRKYYRNN